MKLAAAAGIFVITAASASIMAGSAATRAEATDGSAPATSCATTSACIEGDNTSTGPGVKGTSTKGHGIVGTTKSKGTTQGTSHAGVLGQDLQSGGGKLNFGVQGTSINGTGVEGTSLSANGVVALSSGGSALFAENNNLGDGAQIIGLNNDGTNSSTQNPSSTDFVGRSGIWGHDDSTDGGRLNVGVAGSSTNGIGISGSSTGYVGINAVGGGTIDNGNNDVPALSVVGGPGGPGFLMIACSNQADNPCTAAAGSRVFLIDNIGDVEITGLLYSAGVCSSGCAGPKRGGSHRVVSYAPTQTVPSLDDFGEAQLVDGHAYVALGADYANVINRQANYLVFITPEGDSRGLYVTGKTQTGFTVRENEGGHSTLAFSYRIVAKPYGSTKPRLPMEAVGRKALVQTR